jgi:sugar phosphate isomerase/epimerase
MCAVRLERLPTFLLGYAPGGACRGRGGQGGVNGDWGAGLRRLGRASGPAEWNFSRGPVTLGLVPEAYRAERVEALKRWADFAANIGAPAIITHCGFIPENLTDPEYPPVVDAIREAAEHCAARGLGFWFETGQETPVVLLRTIERVGTGNLGINLDPANLILYGKGNPIDALDVLGPYIKNVHVKDGFYPTDGSRLGREVPPARAACASRSSSPG